MSGEKRRSQTGATVVVNRSQTGATVVVNLFSQSSSVMRDLSEETPVTLSARLAQPLRGTLRAGGLLH
jgi:hypothetical protein